MAQSVLKHIPVKSIRENPEALRGVNRKDEEWQLLRDSVEKHGVLTPIIVREISDPETGESYFGLVDGLQRFTAASELGLPEIPANIVDKDESEVIETQFIANAKRIQTKPAEYARAILHILERNPLLTKRELSQRLSMTESWLDNLLKLNELEPALQKLVDEGAICAANGISLAKLPPEEQMANMDLAQTMGAAEFTKRIALRVKEINEAKRKGRDAAPQEWQPFPHPRKPAEIKEEFENPRIGAELVKKMGCKNAVDGFKAGIAWVCQMDPVSVEALRQKEEDRKLKAKEANEKKKAERQQQKEQQAADRKAELLQTA